MNKPPFLLLFKGPKRFNKARTFDVNQVSVKALPWVLLLLTLPGGDDGRGKHIPQSLLVSAAMKWHQRISSS